MLVISHTANSHTIARAVCRLCFNFPHASIHWWYEPIEGRTDPPFTKKVFDFSYSLPFGVVGYYYPDYCNICVARPKFKVGYRHGKVVFGRLEKCYTDRELVSIYKDHPFWVGLLSSLCYFRCCSWCNYQVHALEIDLLSFDHMCHAGFRC